MRLALALAGALAGLTGSGARASYGVTGPDASAQASGPIGLAAVALLVTGFGILVARRIGRRTLRAAAERDRLSRDLALREAVLSDVLRASADGIAILDDDLRVTMLSERGHRLIGHPAEAVSGRRFADLLPAAAAPAVADALRVARAGGRGTARLALPGREGAPDGLCLTAVASVDPAAGDRFVVSLQAAAAAAPPEPPLLREAFMAMMGHEIRNPLTAMQGYVDLLEAEETLSGRQRRYVASAAAATAGLRGTVDQLLDLSRLETGQAVLEPEDVFLPALVAAAAKAAAPAAAEKGLALVAAIDPALAAPRRGDAARLHQVLLALLDAVLRGARPAEGAVTLRAESQDGAVRLVLAAPGHRSLGTLVAQLAASQVPPTEEEAHSAAAPSLSLRLAGRLLGLMRARFGAEGAESGEAALWIDLDLPAAVPARSPPDRGAARILLADDLLLNRELGRLVLEQAGHRVDVVGDGRAAVAAVAKGGYDLALLDLRMPGLDGLAATRAIRALPPPHNALPVIVLSDDALAESLSGCRAAGADDILPKPFATAGLRDAVARWLPAEPLVQAAPA
ncbi:response regulator [Methylobacterium sp. JK268]